MSGTRQTQVGTTLPGVVSYYDLDAGTWIGIMAAGHVDDESATALATAEASDHHAEGSLMHPVRCWVRRVPCTDYYGQPSWRYCFADRPGRGARPVTRVELHFGSHQRCAAPYCWDPVHASVRGPGRYEWIPMCLRHYTEHETPTGGHGPRQPSSGKVRETLAA